MRLIDADAFSEQYGNYYAEEGPAEGFIGTVGDLIAKQPTIEAEPVRHGLWIETRYNLVGDTMYCDCNCSNCIFEITREKGRYPKFCENCGAQMDATDTNVCGKGGAG